MKSVELREEIVGLTQMARNIIDTASKEKRELSHEQSLEVDRIFADVDIKEQDVLKYEREEKLVGYEDKLKESRGRKTANQKPVGTQRSDGVNPFSTNQYFREWSFYGHAKHVSDYDVIAEASTRGINLTSRTITLGNLSQRATIIGSAGTGKYTATPDGSMLQSVHDHRKAFSVMRDWANVIPTPDGNDLPIPTNDDSSNLGVLRTDETAQIGVGTDPTFAQVVLKQYQITSEVIPVSHAFLRDTYVTAFEAWLTRALGTRLGRKEATYFAVGTGSGQPKGFVAAASSGSITTATTTSVSADDLLSLKYSVDGAYDRDGAFYMNRDTAGYVRRLKDDTQKYLWEPSLQAGMPSTFDNSPVVQVYEMAGLTAAQKAVVFGDTKNEFVISWTPSNSRRLLGVFIYSFITKYLYGIP